MAAVPWALLPDKLEELQSAIAFRAAGHNLTTEEIRARIGDTSGRPSTLSKRAGVAIIPVRGVIAHRMGMMDDTSGGTSCERIGAMLDAVAADDSIGTIVYDFDTPGGTVTGLPELASKMFALRGVKRQIAVANATMASGGYFLASQADEIVAIPSATALGMIGVYCVHQSLTRALEKEGIDITVISAGKYKTERLPFGPLSDDAKAHLQTQVDGAYDQFVMAVARGRGVTASAVRNGFGQGRILGTQEAIALGLIDGVGTLDGTVANAVNGRGTRGASALVASSDDAIRRRLSGLPSAASDDFDRACRLRLL